MALYQDIHAELLEHGTSILCEPSGLPCALDFALRPVWPAAAVAGPACPVRCAPGDNLGIHIALDAMPPGHVLVVDAFGYIAGYWGEVLTVGAQAKQVLGLVIGVRDIAGGRPMITAIYNKILTYMRSFPDVWFASDAEIADWVMSNKLQPDPRRLLKA
jgi:regulator of RNase E activity RraA